MGKNRNVPEPTLAQQLLTPLRESIVDKPPYTSGTLRLPNSCFSLFYKATKDSNNARYERRRFPPVPEGYWLTLLVAQTHQSCECYPRRIGTAHPGLCSRF